MFQNIGEISLFYEKSGTGPAMLLLHGNGEDHTIFNALVKKLTPFFTVYAIDSRGHGKSSPTNTFSYETMAEDISIFIEMLSIDSVNLIGFSDGAIIGLLLALKYPNLLKKIALLGVNLSPKDFKSESLTYLQAEYDTTKAPLLKLMLEEPNISLKQASTIKIPTLLIAADNDIFKPETFTNLAQTMPNAKLIILENQEHDTYIKNVTALTPSLLSFFQE